MEQLWEGPLTLLFRHCEARSPALSALGAASALQLDRLDGDRAHEATAADRGAKRKEPTPPLLREASATAQ